MAKQETLEELLRLKVPPKGYRLVSIKEFARRYRRCLRSDRWSDLDRMSIYDPETRKFSSIDSIPYIWRGYVEKLPDESARLSGKGGGG